jgi:hypothetical protein
MNKTFRHLFLPSLGAILLALVATFWLYPVHVGLSTLSTDFLEYCMGVIAMDDQTLGVPFKRSQLPGALPWLLSLKLGVLNSLAAASAASLGLAALSVYAWGRIAGWRAGRVAGRP